MMGLIIILESITTIQPEKVEKTELTGENDIKIQTPQVQPVENISAHQYKTEQKVKNRIRMKQLRIKKMGVANGLQITLVPGRPNGCIQSFLGGGPRLVEPMYLCQLHTHQQYYGSIHNQLSKRRAQVTSEDLHQFSIFFIIKAYLPMLESHNFCFDILDKTQGTVNAQLDLDTWKIIQEDPFYAPLTFEEIEENGLDNHLYNGARLILEKNREKKGLVGTKKTVVAAQKQSTLKKN